MILRLILLVVLSLGSVIGNATDYAFDVRVEGKGTPIVLIPGLGCSGEVWDATVQQLKSHYTVHVVTLPGFAGQPPIALEQGYLPVVQHQLEEYIRRELKEQPIIVGHSLGGFLAMAIAATQPDLVQKIVVVDAYPFYTAALNPMATAETAKPQAENLKQMLLKMPEAAFKKQQEASLRTMITNAQQVQQAVEWSLQSDRATLAQAMYEIMTTDLREAVANIQCPILVLGSWYGAKDFGVTREMVEANYRNQFQKAPQCTIRIASTARHFIMWDEPQWFFSQLQEFLGNEQ